MYDSSKRLPQTGYYRYEPTLLLPSMAGKENSLLEIRVASPYLTYDNTKVKKRELWGTDIYTDDSDVVASTYHPLSVRIIIPRLYNVPPAYD